MNSIRLAGGALNQTPLAWETNKRHILAAIDAARAAGVHVLCLPELCITGYGCEDMFFSAGVQRTALELLTDLVTATRGLVVCFGLPVVHDGAIHNAAALACDGRLVGFVAKQILAGDGIHYEPRWFKPWPRGKVSSVEVTGKSYPLGDLLFDCGGLKIGFEICRDAWVEDRPGAGLARRGADLILNPSASHFAFAKQEIREEFVLEGSRDFGVGFVYTNLLGNEAGRSIYDGGTLIAAGGKMLARGPRFSYADWQLTMADVDGEALRRAKPANLAKPAADDGGETVSAPVSFPARSSTSEVAGSRRGIVLPTETNKGGWKSIELTGDVPGHPAWETGRHVKEEEFARTVALGLFDYLRKSGARGFVVSLSGGADSSTVAVLGHLMVRFAGAELGAGGLASKLVRGDAATDADWQRWTGRLLTCVYQATRNSSDKTLRAANTVAEAVGARFYQWNVDRMVEDYLSTVGSRRGSRLVLGEGRSGTAERSGAGPRPRRLAFGKPRRSTTADDKQPQ